MIHHRAEPFGKTRILRVFSPERGRFEVRADDGELLGRANDEVRAIWSAVLAADIMSEQGYRVRVLTRNREAHRDLLVLPDLDLTTADVHDPGQLAAQIGRASCRERV